MTIFSSVFSFRSQRISWQLREIIEIGAVFGFALGAYALRRTTQRREHVEAQLRLASGAFSTLLQEQFSE